MSQFQGLKEGKKAGQNVCKSNTTHAFREGLDKKYS